MMMGELMDTWADLPSDLASVSAELDAIFDSAPDGIIIYDRDGRILRANSLARDYLGLGATYEHYASRPLAERAHLFGQRDESGQLMPNERSPMRRVIAGERLSGADAVDIMMRSPDGREWQLSVSGTPIRDVQGCQSGAVCVFRDVTERRRLERHAQQTLEAFIAITRTLVEAPDEADALRGAAGETLHEEPTGERAPSEPSSRHQENPLARRLTELVRNLLGCSRVAVTSAEEVGGRLYDWPVAIAGMTTEEEHQWWTEQLAARPREVGSGLSPEDRKRLLAGEVTIVDLTRPPYQPSNPYGITALLWTAMRIQGRIVGFLALDYKDPSRQPHVFTREEIQIAEAVARLGALVLERERLLRERAAAQARALALQDANRRMDAFMSIASHELRTPMTSVKANIQMAERALRSVLRADGLTHEEAASVARAHDLLTRADRHFNRQNRLIGDLLDVSQLRAGRLELRRERIDLAELVRDLLEEQRLANPERTITSVLDPGPLPVFADPDRVEQVLVNYLSNALKYSEEERPVSVWLRVRGRVARVSVRDRGQGLPPEEQGRIWKRFYRVASIKEQSGSSVGLGLGLFLCRQIIEQHGGQVGVRSAPGKGATFWFTLPLLDEGAAASPA